MEPDIDYWWEKAKTYAENSRRDRENYQRDVRQAIAVAKVNNEYEAALFEIVEFAAQLKIASKNAYDLEANTRAFNNLRDMYQAACAVNYKSYGTTIAMAKNACDVSFYCDEAQAHMGRVENTMDLHVAKTEALRAGVCHRAIRDIVDPYKED